MNDIVQRLRTVMVEDRGHGHFTRKIVNPDGPEAADLIEALTKERDDWKLDCEVARLSISARDRDIEAQAAEIERLKAVSFKASNAAYEMKARAEAAEAEVAKLKEALDYCNRMWPNETARRALEGK